MIRRRLSAAGAVISCLILLTACSGQPAGSGVTAADDVSATTAVNENGDLSQTGNDSSSSNAAMSNSDPAPEGLFHTDESGGLRATLVIEKPE